ncbi:peroxisomal biogenesis factor 6 isoform X2 [Leptinotarsa decemlineata]|uniref:peroxisomal biogenesis factor 6 isoform X2 n=1 Tax=Leptinotarsa decemlineata TaxID=7539 RepID=UPI003D303E5A
MNTDEIVKAEMKLEYDRYVSALFSTLRTIYPKYHPFWFIFYMYILYYRIVKRKIKYKLKSVSDEVIRHFIKSNNNFNDVNNIVIVQKENVYKSDKILRLFSEENRCSRYVHVVPATEGNDTETLLVADDLYYNLENSGFRFPLRLLNIHCSNVTFADEINISLINSPFDINNSVIDSILERYFKTPKLINKEDIISIDVKYFASDLYFLNSKLKNVHNIYFKCNSVKYRNVDIDKSCYCVIGETAVKQSNNIQSFLPKKSTKFVGQEGGVIKEIPTCPYGLSDHLENMQVALRPFLRKRKVNLHPAFLMVGNAGSGKRLLVSCLAARLGMHYYEINNYELSANVYAHNESKLHNVLFTGKMAAPCIIGIHNFESFGKNSEGQYDERIMGNFSDELKFLFENNIFPVFLFCCSNQKDIPTNLRKLFLETFEIGAPSELQREHNLRWILEEERLNTDIMLSEIANKTHGFFYEDLRALVYHARRELRKRTSQSDKTDICETDFFCAIDYMQNNYNESLGAPKVPKVQWSDVGGLSNVKEEIKKTIYLPLRHPAFLKNSGLKRSGILLFGPPGTGKTLIAKAVATECNLCFLSVKGPELLNMYVGQSEQNIREVFERARQASPCIIFFDELDSLAPNRGISGDSGGVMDRVVSQLLAEMDGLNDSATIFIIGATNRPDLIDPALLRPGRFDKLLYIGPCTDKESKLSVLKALTRKFSLSNDVNLIEVVKISPKNITGADFYGICSSAWSSAVRRLIKRIENGN